MDHRGEGQVNSPSGGCSSEHWASHSARLPCLSVVVPPSDGFTQGEGSADQHRVETLGHYNWVLLKEGAAQPMGQCPRHLRADGESGLFQLFLETQLLDYVSSGAKNLKTKQSYDKEKVSVGIFLLKRDSFNW